MRLILLSKFLFGLFLVNYVQLATLCGIEAGNRGGYKGVSTLIGKNLGGTAD